MSGWELGSPLFADIPMDRYAWKVDDQFSNHFINKVTDDCIGNFMFLVDHNPYDVRPFLSSSYEHHSEEMIVTTDDQDPITKELESPQFSSSKIVMAKQEAAIDIQLFPEYQKVSDVSFKDPMVVFIEFYI